MKEDLLGEGNPFDMEDPESINMNSSDEYDVVPQKLETFKLIFIDLNLFHNKNSIVHQ